MMLENEVLISDITHLAKCLRVGKKDIMDDPHLRNLISTFGKDDFTISTNEKIDIHQFESIIDDFNNALDESINRPFMSLKSLQYFLYLWSVNYIKFVEEEYKLWCKEEYNRIEQMNNQDLFTYTLSMQRPDDYDGQYTRKKYLSKETATAELKKRLYQVHFLDEPAPAVKTTIDEPVIIERQIDYPGSIENVEDTDLPEIYGVEYLTSSEKKLSLKITFSNEHISIIPLDYIKELSGATIVELEDFTYSYYTIEWYRLNFEVTNKQVYYPNYFFNHKI